MVVPPLAAVAETLSSSLVAEADASRNGAVSWTGSRGAAAVASECTGWF